MAESTYSEYTNTLKIMNTLSPVTIATEGPLVEKFYQLHISEEQIKKLDRAPQLLAPAIPGPPYGWPSEVDCPVVNFKDFSGKDVELQQDDIPLVISLTTVDLNGEYSPLITDEGWASTSASLNNRFFIGIGPKDTPPEPSINSLGTTLNVGYPNKGVCVSSFAGFFDPAGTKPATAAGGSSYFGQQYLRKEFVQSYSSGSGGSPSAVRKITQGNGFIKLCLVGNNGDGLAMTGGSITGFIKTVNLKPAFTYTQGGTYPGLSQYF